MSLLTDLHVPTNPAYQFDVDPADQDEYGNPVTVANHVLALSNAALQVTTKIVANNKKAADLKRRVQDAEYAVEDFENELLGTYPPNASDRKSNKLLAAYLRQIAHEAGRSAEYSLLLETHRKLKQDEAVLEVQQQSAWQVWQLIKLKGEHYQTYLSFKKHEYDQHK